MLCRCCRWQRGEGSTGLGITRVLQDGRLLEKAAASVSIVHGTLTPERARAMSGRGREGIDAAGGQTYSAAALSLVFHSRR
jgi:coproporphyrinogen III oxidase